MQFAVISVLRLHLSPPLQRTHLDVRRLQASLASSTTRCIASNSVKHLTLANEEHSTEFEAKKSRFLTWVWPVSSPEEALSRIQHRADPSASHNCWAYRIGPHYRSTDDGEPGGTAGRPMLAAIESEKLDGVCVLVIRYFGGVKLGTGGLVRAYGGAARACLRDAPKREVSERATLSVRVPFDCLGRAYQAADAMGGRRAGEEFVADDGRCGSSGEQGVMLLTLDVEADKVHALAEALRDASGGRIRVSECESGTRGATGLKEPC